MPLGNNEVNNETPNVDTYEDIVKYLLIVRKKVKEPRVDYELIYAYAKLDRLGDIVEFIVQPNVCTW